MGQRARCHAMTQAGNPCQSFAITERGFCISHDPEMQDRKMEGSRRGGEAKANARRVAKQWAAMGDQVSAADLPTVLNACMVAVWDGSLTPAQAQAIAALAKSSVSIMTEIEMADRMKAVEEALGMAQGPANIRRIA